MLCYVVHGNRHASNTSNCYKGNKQAAYSCLSNDVKVETPQKLLRKHNKHTFSVRHKTAYHGLQY